MVPNWDPRRPPPIPAKKAPMIKLMSLCLKILIPMDLADFIFDRIECLSIAACDKKCNQYNGSDGKAPMSRPVAMVRTP